MKILLVSLAYTHTHTYTNTRTHTHARTQTHTFASYYLLNLKSYTINDGNTQGPDPSLVYRPNLEREAKEKEEYRNFEVSLNSRGL